MSFMVQNVDTYLNTNIKMIALNQDANILILTLDIIGHLKGVLNSGNAIKTFCYI